MNVPRERYTAASIIRISTILEDNQYAFERNHHDYIGHLVTLLRSHPWVVEMDCLRFDYKYLCDYLRSHVYYDRRRQGNRARHNLPFKAIRGTRITMFSTLVGVARYNANVLPDGPQSRIYDKITKKAIQEFTLQICTM